MGIVTCQECALVTQDGQVQTVRNVLREVHASMVAASIDLLNANVTADTMGLLVTFQHVRLDATKQGAIARIQSYVTADQGGRERTVQIALRNMDA